MNLEFRAIGPDELGDLDQTLGLAFGVESRPGNLDLLKPVLPLDRTRCAFVDGAMVGTSGAFELEMTVPGATVRCAGTTMVGVAPTHRRRGILRQMMRAHLDDVREHEEPIAALWASDSAIYDRFGYGMASVNYRLKLNGASASLHRLAPGPGPVRFVDGGEGKEMLSPFFDKRATEIPGFFARSPEWWDNRNLADPEWRRHGMTPQRIAVIDGEDGIEGFVRYRAKLDWDEGHGAGRLSVIELLGSSPRSWASLWSFVLGHDLTQTIEAGLRPPWDPIFSLLAGPRRVGATMSDALWVRIMDIPKALTARRYSAPIDLVLELRDPMEDTTETYRLVADEERAECEPSSDPASISMDLADLGACYLGRSRFRALAETGRLSGDPESLATADRAFTWWPEPWCPEIF